MADRASILVVSSDPEAREAIRRCLSEYTSCSVKETAQSGEAVLWILEKEVDLIILDLQMEGLKGLTTLQILKRSRPKIPVVVISDSSSVEVGSQVMQQGVFYYLLKPIDDHELSEVIGSALQQHPLVSRLQSRPLGGSPKRL